MIFEPKYLHEHVLDFYRNAGIAGKGRQEVTLCRHGPERVSGSALQFEQTLYFLMGHLLPADVPLSGDLVISRNSLTLHYRLPELGKINGEILARSLQDDARFQWLVDSGLGHGRLHVADDHCPVVGLDLDFPVSPPDDREFETVLDLVELEERFESLELALPLLENFLERLRSNMTQLSRAIQMADWTSAYRMAHSLQGGALNVSAQSCAHSARIVETMIKEQQYDAIPDAMMRLAAACDELESVWEIHYEGFYG